MRRRIYLYLGDTLADLDDDSFILQNFRKEDLTSPAAVINSWTQNIKLPRTQANAALLGHYYRLDRRTIGSGGTVGTDYNALKRTPFQLFAVDGTRIQRGYFKLVKVTDAAYEVALYGGLGGLMYALTYGAARKLTLADCPFSYGNISSRPADQISIPCTAASVYDAWGALRYGAPSSGTVYDIINFAPALNGTTYPFKFDTNKAYLRQGSGTANQVPNIPTSVTQSGKTYRAYPDDGLDPTAALLEMSRKHNEWEVQDLRCYCQRPVISMRALLTGIRNLATSLGYTLSFDSGYFNSDMEYFEKVWMTLPFLNRDNLTRAQLASLTAADYLGGTATPADYLLAVAKTFGFAFITEPDGETITMRLRDNFYTFSDVVDLTERVDISREMEVSPFRIGARYYEFVPDKVEGAFAADYLARWGGKYGRQVVDTGYDFDGNTNEVMQGVAFAGAADVRDKNANYASYAGDVTWAERNWLAQNYAFKFAFSDEVKYTLYWWDEEDFDVNEIETISVTPTAWPQRSLEWASGSMFMNLTQLHDADGKALSGENILLFYNGTVTPPFHRVGNFMQYEAIFHLSNDPSYAELLNGGVPCWQASRGAASDVEVAFVPSFQRCLYSGNNYLFTLDFGDPKERAATGQYVQGYNIYESFWSMYIGDRLDKDTTVLRCYVDLEGLQVGEALLRKLYKYGGAMWTLNAIENHSLTTAGPTLCEFVKVQDISNYTSGQYQI